MSTKTYEDYLKDLLKANAIPYLEKSEFFEQQQKLNSKSQEGANLANGNSNEQTKCSQEQKFKLKTNMSPLLEGKLVERYCRQMLLKEISYEGQLNIVNSKIALIGSGGIGCPLAMYLAGAGVGKLGLFDSDTVQITNLHRQIAHKNCSIGIKKTTSLKNSILAFNPNIKVHQHQFITVQNAHELSSYDFVIDGSDNPECRYIVNDYCMKSGKKLLSGACIGWEGQVTCYGGNGPCYRCIWGNEQRTSGGCSTLGVVGMLPGFVGIILAIQAIKMIINGNSSLQGNLLTYESKSATFRKLKLRPKVTQCIGCGQNKLDMNSYEYSKHAICKPNLSNLPQVQEISWIQVVSKEIKQKILDVRPSNHFGISHLENMVNIPYEKLITFSRQQLVKEFAKNQLLNSQQSTQSLQIVYVSCNRGVMSKRATKFLNQLGFRAVSVKGGITEYSKSIDTTVPTF